MKNRNSKLKWISKFFKGWMTTARLPPKKKTLSHIIPTRDPKQRGGSKRLKIIMLMMMLLLLMTMLIGMVMLMMMVMMMMMVMVMVMVMVMMMMMMRRRRRRGRGRRRTMTMTMTMIMMMMMMRRRRKKMMMWMLRRRRRRRRKMLMLRRMTLRRKTDPKTGKHTWREPAQSKSTWTLHNSNFVWKFTGKMPDASLAASVLCEPAQSTCTWSMSEEQFCAEIYRFYKENAGRFSRGQRFVRACAVEMRMDMSEEAFCAEIYRFYRENAGRFSRGQRFVRACAVEMRMDMSEEAFCAEIYRFYRENAGRFSRGKRFVRACAVEMRMDMSEEAFCAEIYKENAGRPGYHLNWIEHRALTPNYRKNPSVWPHCLGKNTKIVWYCQYRNLFRSQSTTLQPSSWAFQWGSLVVSMHAGLTVKSRWWLRSFWLDITALQHLA